MNSLMEYSDETLCAKFQPFILIGSAVTGKSYYRVSACLLCTIAWTNLEENLGHWLSRCVLRNFAGFRERKFDKKIKNIYDTVYLRKTIYSKHLNVRILCFVKILNRRMFWKVETWRRKFLSKLSDNSSSLRCAES